MPQSVIKASAFHLAKYGHNTHLLAKYGHNTHLLATLGLETEGLEGLLVYWLYRAGLRTG